MKKCFDAYAVLLAVGRLADVAGAVVVKQCEAATERHVQVGSVQAEGLNLVQIAHMGHFPAKPSKVDAA
jgi:hypothetical protein